MKRSLILALLICISCTQTRHNDKLQNKKIGIESRNNSSLVVVSHPLMQHFLCILRNRNTKPSDFRASLEKISEFLIIEATKNLHTTVVDVETPIEKTICKCIDPNQKIIIAPILRAGIAITSVAEKIIPDAVIQFLGMYRNEKTHEPVWYYNKLPATLDNPSDIKVFICDPMLATGGSAYEAIKIFLDKGIKEENVTFVCVICTPEGLEKLFHAFPKITIVTASLDRKLNEQAYIVPGLGDAGDRIFNTAK
ncbi:MAG: uracil phosphoribosyltransferase [Holosporaceae bacterium]|jgi:uracil phosphoribosyltransferase|nr:uracil phosphoribosyltransferase [Holosporaceae bacterium]